ncbi:AsmA family protein [Natronospira sp.]|uniref:AsmA family protein n=1 Tax=Natronospira sp. TaxID=2024970 RepID=UPI0038730059
MKKWLIWLGATVGGLLVLLVVAAVIAAMVIDPNDYRDDIQDAVRDATGRELHIDDELSLSFFPWLGIETGHIALGNAEGFEGDFFSLDAADIRLRLLPLIFRRQVEVAEIRVEGLRLNLALNEEGVSNWDDLVADVDPEAVEEEAPEAAEFDLAELERIRIGGLRLIDAALSWNDQSTGMRASISNWSLSLGEIRLGEPLAFSTALDFDLNEPALSGHFEGQARLIADLAGDGAIRIEAMQMALDAEGEPLPVSPLALRLDWRSLSLDPEAQRLVMEDMSGRIADMPFAGGLQIEQLDSDPLIRFELFSGDFPGSALMPFIQDGPEGLDLSGVETVNWRLAGGLDTAADRLTLDGFELRLDELTVEADGSVDALQSETPEAALSLSVSEFSPRALLTRIGLADMLPQTRDPDVLEHFALRAGIEHGREGLRLADLNIQLDETLIEGELVLPVLDPPALRFAFQIDAIDLDRYTEPDADEPPPEEGEPLDLDAIEIPADAIRGHDIEGSIRIGELGMAGIAMTSVRAGVSIRDDVLRLSPISADLYGGTQTGELVVDASGEVPSIRFSEELAGVRIGDLLKDMFEMEQITGLANITMEVAGQGHTVGELRPTLNGNMRLRFEEGALEGVDVAYQVSQATVRFREAAKVREDRGRTPFSALGISGTVEDGELISDDFGMLVENFAIRGSGSLSLVDLSLDYNLRARILEDPPSELRADDFDVRGRELHFRVTGTVLAPRLRFDIESLLRDQAGEEVRERARDLEDRLRDRFQR